MPTSKKPVGRPRTLDGERSSGRETRLPRPKGFQVAPMQLPLRIYAPDQHTAQRIGGPDVLAVKRVTLGVGVETWARVKNAAHALPGLDVMGLVELLLSNGASALEEAYNGGEKFAAPTKKKRARNAIHLK
jgi:hypothetical protein